MIRISGISMVLVLIHVFAAEGIMRNMAKSWDVSSGATLLTLPKKGDTVDTAKGRGRGRKARNEKAHAPQRSADESDDNEQKGHDSEQSAHDNEEKSHDSEGSADYVGSDVSHEVAYHNYDAVSPEDSDAIFGPSSEDSMQGL